MKELASGRVRRWGRLLGAAAEEAENDSGGGPIIVLAKIGAEGGAGVVEVEQTDVDMAGGEEATTSCLSLAWARPTISCVAGAVSGGFSSACWR